jgi:plasmid stability protein
MASITVRNLDEELKARLRLRAASHQHSMEEEVREILRQALKPDVPSPDLATLARSLFGSQGAEISLPVRRQGRAAPELEQ